LSEGDEGRGVVPWAAALLECVFRTGSAISYIYASTDIVESMTIREEPEEAGGCLMSLK
jgi:hypothetical protein